MEKNANCRVCGGIKRIKDSLYGSDLFSNTYTKTQTFVLSRERDANEDCAIEVLRERGQYLTHTVWCSNCGLMYHENSVNL